MQCAVPPFPVLCSPAIMRFSVDLFSQLQKKYKVSVEVVPVSAPLHLLYTSLSPTASSCSSTSQSSPSPSECNAKEKKLDSPPDRQPECALQACQCNICGKKFSRHWLLQGHLRTHTGEKPFKCEVCGKAFADKSNLRAHVQTHSGNKPHECLRCHKRFALKSYLSKHEESACTRAG